MTDGRKDETPSTPTKDEASEHEVDKAAAANAVTGAEFDTPADADADVADGRGKQAPGDDS